MEQEIQKKGEVILYHPSETIKLEVRLENETVWLTQQQIADLFGTKRPAITKHLRNIFKCGELDQNSVSSILEHTASDGKIYSTQFYNLDAILSVGYRVNSINATQFRRWANSILKEYLIKGYVVNNNILATMQKQIDDRFISLQEHTDNRLHDMEKHLEQHDEQITFFIRTNQPPIEGVFFEGQVLDASLNELGRRLFAFSKMSIRKEQIL